MSGARRVMESIADDEAGFTLVELLVALALFSLLVTLLIDNVGFGLRVWRHGGAHAEHLQKDMIAQDLVRRMIGNIYPMLVGNGDTQPKIDFEGTSDAISFLGNAPMVVSGGGRYRFKLFIERTPDRADMIISATPELANPQAPFSATRTLLLSDIGMAEFSYFGEGVKERRERWQDSWSERSDLPRLVRIRVTFRSDDDHPWPELLIAPRIAADVSCVYDSLTTRCRGR
jgi:general secretion pathway protein J